MILVHRGQKTSDSPHARDNTKYERIKILLMSVQYSVIAGRLWCKHKSALLHVMHNILRVQFTIRHHLKIEHIHLLFSLFSKCL